MIRATARLAHWGVTGVTVAQVLAMTPPVAVATIYAGQSKLFVLVAALMVVLFWEVLFAFVRKRWISVHGLTVALIVAVLAPADLPISQLAVVLSLGLVLGELIFGGRGFGFLAPATVSLSLLVFSFPQAGLASVSPEVALAIVPGAALLLFLGLISWRVILGANLAVLALLALQGLPIDPILIAPALTFGLIFLICDPTAAASTNPGRWLYGVLTGILIALFSSGDGATPTEAVVFAALLSSVFAPLIDHLVILADAARRRRRNG